MQFVIDRSTWRCGGESRDKHGKGRTSLLNNDGYMCCLGQVCQQLGQMNILNIDAPSILEIEIEPLTIKEGNYTSDTELSDLAMSINDNSEYSRIERERLLSELFSSFGHEITFINNYLD